MARSTLVDSTFGAVLRRHRLAAGLTQEALAERARMSAEGIGALERGRRRAPYRATVALLAEALRLAPEGVAELEAAAAIGSRPRAGRAASPETNDSERHNLPTPPNKLLGREHELAELRALVAEARLVTVTGAGGIGKTRVALEIGRELIDRGENGVWFIDLANVPAPNVADRAGATSRAGVVAVIARVFELAESPRAPLLETLAAHLAGRSLTLIFDNCEHVIAAAAAVAETLLRTCPRVRVVATSREPLRIDYEQVYRLPSLSVPTAAAARTLDAEAAAGFAAIELFALRGKAVQSRFVLTHENAPTVADICRRLDGIPLALELAAARLNVLDVAALAVKLEARFALLAGGARTSLPRQQTMRALIDWSYDLLTPAEQHVFERFAIFAGGCDLRAAAALHGDVAGEFEVLELLGSLVDKSLVVADFADGGEARYRLLESTRAYAYEKLVARGEVGKVAQRHAQTYTALAEHLERAQANLPDEESRRAEVELENWRAALDWALVARGDVVLGQRLAGALWPVWTRVSNVEGRRWISAALALIDESTPPQLRALLELGSTRMSTSLGDWELAVADGRRAIDAFDDDGDERRAAHARCEVGMALLCSGRGVQAGPLLDSALTVARAHGDRRLIVKVLHQLVYERSQAGDLARAREYADEALAQSRIAGVGEEVIAGIRLVLGEAEFLAGNVEQALELAAEATAAARRASRPRTLAPVLLNRAAYAIAAERWDDARAASIEALGLSQETQRLVWRAWALQHLAAIAVLSAGAAVADRVRVGAAARIVGYVDARVAALRAQREYTEQHEYERVCAALRAKLGDAETARLLAEGEALDHDRALELAQSL
jgi:predicted ATPase/DNA-binding XRE family transcriptional regulator